jgi:WD40 repeat protein
MTAVVVCGLLFLGMAIQLNAAEPPSEPILRLETGMHTAAIKRIASDAQGRWVVSASEDKTLRLWDARTGDLRQTYRVPVGKGLEGRLDAVAMSPDGDWIAAGGWTQFNKGKLSAAKEGFSIYLFHRPSGRLTQRLDGHENIIIHLCFAPDNRLAATLWGSSGVHLYAPQSQGSNTRFQAIGADHDYGGDSYGCAFAGDGRLVTSSWDGYIRLYDSYGHLVQQRNAPGGKRPYGVAFRPGQDEIALGYDDSTRVDILDGHSLKPIAQADTDGVDKGSLSSVAWSHDGQLLFAGGGYAVGDKPIVRVWNRGGRGTPREWQLADNTIMSIQPLLDDGLLLGAADPLLARLDARGQQVWQQRGATADVRKVHKQSFELSHDAREVVFGLDFGGQRPVWFDLAKRRLQPAPESVLRKANPVEQLQQRLNEAGYDPGGIDGSLGSKTRAALDRWRRDQGLGPGGIDATVRQRLGLGVLAPPRTQASRLKIEGCKNTRNPCLNGQALKLEQYEWSRSLAIAPDGRGFVLGTRWFLRAFNARGQQLWQKAVPGNAWGVNISGDGRLLVAALGDGTLRWYRYDNGEELLALFVHKNGTDWVLWTPSGYYDASPGADKYIGWHRNNGKDQEADFFPASALRDRFYRPLVVANILSTLNESEAIALANQQGERTRPEIGVAESLPPVVELLSPVDGSVFSNAQLTLNYRIRNPGGGAMKGVQVLVDGRPLEGPRGLQRVNSDNDSQQLSLTLPERDLQLSLIAENQHGASVPATVRLKWQGQKRDEFVIKPKLYVLAIGVADYRDNALDLQYPAKDARDFAAVLQPQQGDLYREVVTKLLENPTSEAVLDGLDWLRKEVTSKDVAMLFIAGHGVNDDDGDYYYLTAEADPERLRRTAVAYFDIKKTLSSLSGKTLAFIDTCHSGNIMGARRGVADINKVINDLTAAENGVVVFASSSGKQFSLEDPKWNNGAFTRALVEGLSGKANYTQDGRITINQLDLYLSERVKALTNNRQTPVTTKPQTISDYPVAVVR